MTKCQQSCRSKLSTILPVAQRHAPASFETPRLRGLCTGDRCRARAVTCPTLDPSPREVGRAGWFGAPGAQDGKSWCGPGVVVRHKEFGCAPGWLPSPAQFAGEGLGMGGAGPSTGFRLDAPRPCSVPPLPRCLWERVARVSARRGEGPTAAEASATVTAAAPQFVRAPGWILRPA